MFGDLKSAAGVKALNEYLAENSYIEGWVFEKICDRNIIVKSS